MITEFKIFENSAKPRVGNYVVCYDGDSEIEEYLNNNIGKIIKKSKKGYGRKNNLGKYLIKYENIPTGFEDAFNFDGFGTRPMRRYEILYFSSKEKDCEIFINSRKYNI